VCKEYGVYTSVSTIFSLDFFTVLTCGFLFGFFFILFTKLCAINVQEKTIITNYYTSINQVSYPWKGELWYRCYTCFQVQINHWTRHYGCSSLLLLLLLTLWQLVRTDNNFKHCCMYIWVFERFRTSIMSGSMIYLYLKTLDFIARYLRYIIVAESIIIHCTLPWLHYCKINNP
jgi:hypothetical protein